MTKPKKPKTERELCLYRAQLSCKIGRDAIDGNARAPAGTTEMEYAMFNLLHAVEEIAKAMGESTWESLSGSTNAKTVGKSRKSVAVITAAAPPSARRK